MEPHMAIEEDPPFKEWEQLNEKLKQVKAARKRGYATEDDVTKVQREYDRVAGLFRAHLGIDPPTFRLRDDH
jgi:hypothetical protein